jgi:hypothetical protein
LNELSRDNDGVSLAPVLLALDSDSTGPADAPIETVLERNFVLEGGTGDSRSKSDFGDENESEYLRVAVSAGARAAGAWRACTCRSCWIFCCDEPASLGFQLMSREELVAAANSGDQEQTHALEASRMLLGPYGQRKRTVA